MPYLTVTVAIPTYNRSALLGQTLAGVCRQDFPAERLEVLVIDNNSTDATRDVVAAFAGERPAPRYLWERRQGLGYARNRAVAEARGDVILFADDDILARPDWIRRMLEPLEADRGERIGAVGGEVVPHFPDGLPRWLQGAHRPLAYRRDSGPLPPGKNPMGANLAIPRRIFCHHRLFDPELGRRGPRLLAGDEAELINRLRAAGLEIWFVPAAAVGHQMPAARLNFVHVSRHAFDSACSRVIDHARGRQAAFYLLSRFAHNLLKVVFHSLSAVFQACLFRVGEAKKALVRLCRSYGYLHEIARSIREKLQPDAFPSPRFRLHTRPQRGG